MAGDLMPNGAIPRGVLCTLQTGFGKTRAMVAAALYAMARRSDLYTSSALVVVTNGALKQNVVDTIAQYIDLLNTAKLNILFEPQSREINVADVLKFVHFITYNDSRNLE